MKSTTTVSDTIQKRRMLTDKLMTVVLGGALLLAVAILALILGDIVVKGAPAMGLTFFTNSQRPPNVPGGGIANSLVGTLIIVAIGTGISVPIGLGAGIFFSEWPESRISFLSSFMNDVLAEFPSIVIGIFVYIILVLTTKSFSAIAGALALGIIMIPIIARTTEESLKLVPRSLREASMALGISKSRTVIRIVLSTGKSGLATGILLAIARAAGETAPLLFTILGNSNFTTSLFGPIGALPLLIYNYGISPFPPWQQAAWGAALVLIIIMLALNLGVKFLIGRRFSEMRAEV